MAALFRGKRALLLLVGLVALAAVAGATLGYFMRFDLPDVRALEDYRPPEMTRVESGAVSDSKLTVVGSM